MNSIFVYIKGTMTELKTKPTEITVEDFLNNVTDEKVRDDCYTITSFA
jgi:hypothetical protein